MSCKTNGPELEMRIGEVMDLLLLGKTRSEILRYAANRWGAAARTVDAYMVAAREEISEINKITATETMDLVVRNMWSIYRRCIDKDDMVTAKGVLVDIAKFKGLAQDTVNHIIHRPKEDLVKMDDDEFENLSARQH